VKPDSVGHQSLDQNDDDDDESFAGGLKDGAVSFGDPVSDGTGQPSMVHE
jgi:hypothetical protein